MSADAKKPAKPRKRKCRLCGKTETANGYQACAECWAELAEHRKLTEDKSRSFRGLKHATEARLTYLEARAAAHLPLFEGDDWSGPVFTVE